MNETKAFKAHAFSPLPSRPHPRPSGFLKAAHSGQVDAGLDSSFASVYPAPASETRAWKDEGIHAGQDRRGARHCGKFLFLRTLARGLQSERPWECRGVHELMFKLLQTSGCGARRARLTELQGPVSRAQRGNHLNDSGGP